MVKSSVFFHKEEMVKHAFRSCNMAQIRSWLSTLCYFCTDINQKKHFIGRIGCWNFMVVRLWITFNLWVFHSYGGEAGKLYQVLEMDMVYYKTCLYTPEEGYHNCCWYLLDLKFLLYCYHTVIHIHVVANWVCIL